MRLYRTPYQDKEWTRHLFEDANHTLYIWCDSQGLVKKIHFELNQKLVLKLDDHSLTAWRLYEDPPRTRKGLVDIFHRSLEQPTEPGPILEETSCLLHKNWNRENNNNKYVEFLAQVHAALHQGKLPEIFFSP